jgi:hypothetical protein
MAEQVPFFRSIDFSTMATPALVVASDKDDSQHFTDIGPKGGGAAVGWRTESGSRSAPSCSSTR